MRERKVRANDNGETPPRAVCFRRWDGVLCGVEPRGFEPLTFALRRLSGALSCSSRGCLECVACGRIACRGAPGVRGTQDESAAGDEQAQAAVDAWVAEYNTDRPHQALDQERPVTPSQRFAPAG